MAKLNKNLINGLQSRMERSHIACVHFRDEDFDLFENRIKLITIHSAKGLEFPVVFVYGLNEGILPRKRNSTSRNDSLEEIEGEDVDELLTDRQLLYVGMTRAASRLFLVGDAASPSRFINDLDPAKIVFGA